MIVNMPTTPARLSTGKWAQWECDMLEEAVRLMGVERWPEVSRYLNEKGAMRDTTQCRQRWKKVQRPDLKKGMWSADEDSRLTSCVHAARAEGKVDWAKLANECGLRRTAKACRERWQGYLDPSVKHCEWTGEEEAVLLRAHADSPKKWAEISRKIPGRTADQVKTKFYSLQRKMKAGERKRQKEAKEAKEAEAVKPTITRLVPASMQLALTGSISSAAVGDSFATLHTVSQMMSKVLHEAYEADEGGEQSATPATPAAADAAGRDSWAELSVDAILTRLPSCGGEDEEEEGDSEWGDEDDARLGADLGEFARLGIAGRALPWETAAFDGLAGDTSRLSEQFPEKEEEDASTGSPKRKRGDSRSSLLSVIGNFARSKQQIRA